MNFSALSIKHPVPAILLFALLTLAGLLAYKANRVQDFPDVELPMVTINATLPGAAPAQLETDVARKIEDTVATLQGVKNVYTNVLDGVVNITVEFILDKDSGEAVNDVREAVSRVRADLPSEMRDPVVTKVSTAGRTLLTYTVTSDQLDEQALSWLVDNTVTKRLLAVPGLGSIKRTGGVTREVRVELDTARMAELGVSAADVSRQLRQVQREAPGGRGEVSGAEQTVRTIATVQSAAELGDLELPLADGRRIRLDQVAQVTDTFAERRAVALHDGRPVVAFEIFRTRGASELDVVNGARQAIEQLRRDHPTARFVEVIDNVAPIAENFQGSMTVLYEGALLAVLVVWWFLRDWRATFVAAVALPLSILPAFLGLEWFGYTLNTVTLTALALVIGVLVDDAIVEVENISRHLRMGKPPYQAAMEAADEIGFAVIATTFALVAVFLPTAFMDGVPGKFFKQFGWAAVLAVLASLVVARLLTPMMAAYMLKPPKHVAVADGWVMRTYLSTVSWCLRHRLVTVIAALGFLVGSLALIPLLPTGFVPPSDRNQTLITLELPPGSTLAETHATAERARLAAQQVKGVKGVFSSVGGGSSGDLFAPGAAAEVRRAVLTLTLEHHDKRRESLKDIESELRAKLSDIPGARFKVGPQDSGVKMQIVLKSDDPAALLAANRAAERDLRTLKGVGNVSSSASLTQPELIVRPDAARAADLGVTTQAIAETVRIATAGDYDTALAKLNLAERQIPIRVKLGDAVRADLTQLERLLVPGHSGPVMLGTVATLSLESGPAEINRLNRTRDVVLEVELGSRQLGEAYDEAMQLPALRNLPPGVSVAELGDAQEMQALFASFGLAMLIGILCIYGVLVLLFHDFTQPATILVALPLSIGGAFIGLLVTGKALSMPSMIGLIMLMGIVTKNSILLVDYAILARRRGLERFEALVDACHKRSRPIVMTTIAMGAGMMPLALGYSADPSFRSPMAVAVIGGLITSTLLSLLVVPAIFTYIDDAKHLMSRLSKLVRRAPAA